MASCSCGAGPPHTGNERAGNGRTLVTGTADGTVKLWPLPLIRRGLREISNAALDPVRSLRARQGGEESVAGEPGRVRVAAASHGQPRAGGQRLGHRAVGLMFLEEEAADLVQEHSQRTHPALLAWSPGKCRAGEGLAWRQGPHRPLCLVVVTVAGDTPCGVKTGRSGG